MFSFIFVTKFVFRQEIYLIDWSYNRDFQNKHKYTIPMPDRFFGEYF